MVGPFGAGNSQWSKLDRALKLPLELFLDYFLLERESFEAGACGILWTIAKLAGKATSQ